ncbi:hypothetical protein HK100_005464 [Physocladia obscura]|uniref:Uncharacterized protein n=1 Tax=Physocladia obscura TaxID=109957 RepID=A0AAD5X9C0_9FUNG|nr:hypothetical protein HK100_005464 [Physocladia obscura]
MHTANTKLRRRGVFGVAHAPALVFAVLVVLVASAGLTLWLRLWWSSAPAPHVAFGDAHAHAHSHLLATPLRYNASALTPDDRRHQRALLRVVAQQVDAASAGAGTDGAGGTGVTFLGSPHASAARLAVQAVLRLRVLGCVLPAEFAHPAHELVAASAAALLAAHNVTVRPFALPPSATGDSGLRLGAAKPAAVLSSPFRSVLFLDPDILMLRDPTPLLHSPLFAKTGALFWPDYRPVSPDRKVWAVMRFLHADVSREWDSGLLLVDKSRPLVRAALEIAQFLCANNDFYFRLFWGDKEAFHWAFRLVAKELWYANLRVERRKMYS